MTSPDEDFEALRLENRQLYMENRKLLRELESERALNRRNRINAEARANLTQIISAEKSRLERYMNLLLANCPDVILLFDQEKRLIFASESYLRLRELPAFGLIRGKTSEELLSPLFTEESWPHIDALFKTAVEGQNSGAPQEFTEKIDFGKKGDFRYYIISVTPMLEGGKTEGIMALFCDTTEIILAKDEAERARAIAEQSTRAKSDFLANMSHEMRTPMNAIIGMTTIAQSSESPEKKDYCLNKIEEASSHLLGVINDVLDMSKIEAGKFDLSPAEFSFEKLLQKVTGVMNFRIDEKRQKFTLSVDEKLPDTLIGDDQRIAQVITNLLSNATKFTPEGGSIHLDAQLLEERDETCLLQIAVSDTGIGISEEQQNRLFTSFQQADTSTSRKFGGTGLGLAISKRIVEMMGGRIWISSQPGKGATFTFTVEVKNGEKKRDSPLQPRAKNFETTPPGEKPDEKRDSFEGFRILLVEDVEINREIVLSLLEPTLLTIDCAENGVEAVELFKENPDRYDMIFMDVQMPQMDGYEATRRIRALDVPAAGRIPIVAMTANVFREDVEKCLAAGMDSHMGKPVDFNEMLNKLRQYLPHR
ncbi:MAG: response regulator [Synergistaceae bacterium]|nr:response regulator [Synergistaceae bacterium]